MKLILSPHPDDAEYSMSATVMKNPETEYVVFLLSDGGDNDPTTSFLRREEAENFWKKIPNVKFISCYSNNTICNMKDWELVGIVDDLLKKYSFDTIYVPPLDDNHFEHRKISECARASLRGKKISLIEYCTPSTRSTWNANHFVDVSKLYKRKLQFLKEFKSQLDRPYFQDYNLSIFHEDYFCRLRGVERVEKFKIEFDFS